MKSIITVMSLILTALLITLCCRGGAAENKKSVEQDLVEAIEKVAVQHGISKEEALKKTGELLVGSQCWPVKGGVAIIRDSMYVIARGKTNEVIADDKTIAGAEYKSPEIFVFADKKFAGSLRLPKGSEEDVVVALFTPDKIRFFDWRELSGGFYPRRQE
jgi:hypothetical protein